MSAWQLENRALEACCSLLQTGALPTDLNEFVECEKQRNASLAASPLGHSTARRLEISCISCTTCLLQIDTLWPCWAALQVLHDGFSAG